tara:strand:+ start:153 stop:599 length:447 start_codon:yes stop_codon:yes gene_type:complete
VSTISFKTALGWITVESNNDKIISIKFGKEKNIGVIKNINKFINQIKMYSFGKLKKFDIKYELSGSPLQILIWRELTKIKYGQTKTYGEIAKKLNTSPRYVGNVCGQNKLLLVIPCHRVVKSDGSLGGFSGLGGLKLKKILLNLEMNV